MDDRFEEAFRHLTAAHEAIAAGQQALLKTIEEAIAARTAQPEPEDLRVTLQRYRLFFDRLLSV